MKNLLFVLFILLLTACGSSPKQQVSNGNTNSNLKQFEVKEVIQTSKYTYLRVTENGTEKWVAVSKTNAAVGDKYYYNGDLQMNNFHSKELNRDFPTIFFISQISQYPIAGNMPASQTQKPIPQPGNGATAHTGRPQVQETPVKLDKKKGELSIAELYQKKKQFANKEITIRGVVVKVNEQVMGRNWVHIQDGTKFGSDFDLTVTGQFRPSINQEITIKGTVFVDKNFGSGYFYPLIIEKATLLSNQ